MIALRFTPRARADFDGIWDYTAENWNLDQAEAYLRAINQALNLLRANPRLGRSASDIGQGLFKFPVASHIIYYRFASSTLIVVRLLHKSMDVEQHL
ncbi:type II toxin-antitoxin system RelE/ParE family toxin [Nordella sp. HKS 07]|uniref:type II toxin-antitoxin system RelE/ParE family toxin n=1 Tax=Nordella sp. HKS 07 TaxID=2712222 RepID=UPI0013E1754A|nr:type II toxin-antitoxin system RelE/ParE family toxin [Nordella sp. HKS 07]QIG46370.1 type II toxin-antitoxin system RelE/ParE family toxin [Nordella sp. HKS 07]